MIYIGIDPEPSGAFCIWDTDFNELNFYTSYEDIQERTNNFRSIIETFILNDVTVIIEDAWIRPNQAAQSMTKYVKSFGAWLGIIYTMGFENVHIVPASTWKKKFGLSDDKDESYLRATQFIKDPSNNIDQSCLKQLRLSSLVNTKQIYDRSEAFLLIQYYRMFIEQTDEDNPE